VLFHSYSVGIGFSPVKGLEAFLTFLDSLATKSPAEIFAGIMPGINAMDNIHPLLVHLPIALFSLFFFLESAVKPLARIKQSDRRFWYRESYLRQKSDVAIKLALLRSH
jgi:hypothetical protein